ncbi:MAG TPA: antitoxin VapB family protein [Thermoplasmata archaeon]|nr:antitoxin VapB family protein [Thermoplasmata archaeon]
MASRTVSLEEGAYVRLKAAKRPGESFSEVVNRVLARDRPTFLSLSGFLSKSDAKGVREVIGVMRELEKRGESRSRKQSRRSDGAYARH